MSTPWTFRGPVAEAPDFANILAVLRRERPARTTLFEFFLNDDIALDVLGAGFPNTTWYSKNVPLYRALGYDYGTVMASDMAFPKPDRHRAESVSLNDGAVIKDRATFDSYPWPDADRADDSEFQACLRMLVPGQKAIVFGPCGVLENVIGLIGFDRLCELLADDPELVQDIFDAVGTRLVAYYRRAAPNPLVGACISNDDWGFKTQTMLSPKQMRKYVIPWHIRIVEAIHAAGKPAILHSCGNLAAVMDDIIDAAKYDAKHSYEDTITKVEEAYERWGKRIAILGGIDVDYVCRHQPHEIYERSAAMLRLTAARGGYALGTGNSVPGYVPKENYYAMIEAAIGSRGRKG